MTSKKVEEKDDKKVKEDQVKPPVNNHQKSNDVSNKFPALKGFCTD
jgi:hypothetical protein